jgi:hypothetical protein
VTSARSRFTLSNGRTIGLQSLKQWAVYAGLLEGLPTRQRNHAELKRLVEEVGRQDGRAPLLITPVQEPIEYEGRYPFGEPARLPSIGCIGRFHSHEPASDSSKDCSDLTIIWFQDDYAFPLSPEVERAIVTVDWDALARDGAY